MISSSLVEFAALVLFFVLLIEPTKVLFYFNSQVTGAFIVKSRRLTVFPLIVLYSGLKVNQ